MMETQTVSQEPPVKEAQSVGPKPMNSTQPPSGQKPPSAQKGPQEVTGAAKNATSQPARHKADADDLVDVPVNMVASQTDLLTQSKRTKETTNTNSGPSWAKGSLRPGEIIIPSTGGTSLPPQPPGQSPAGGNEIVSSGPTGPELPTLGKPNPRDMIVS
ncbi:unnamed protein product [Linum trigynum]|uniref:Uncharacterized protein n=1 Tax=Linum trigynum TaxID=586398 RepID=A0AAV2FDX2_9ROSI